VHRIGPDCDALLVEMTTNEMLSAASRYQCPDCGTRWQWAAVGMLVEDED
jgi:predicted RNA-binding Zn-ribbon protein involved in translation (DUF1610 family)